MISTHLSGVLLSHPRGALQVSRSEEIPQFALPRYPPVWPRRGTAGRKCALTGESRICGLEGRKSRFRRHRTRPPGVDCCGRVPALAELPPELLAGEHGALRQGLELGPGDVGIDAAAQPA